MGDQNLIHALKFSVSGLIDGETEYPSGRSVPAPDSEGLVSVQLTGRNTGNIGVIDVGQVIGDQSPLPPILQSVYVNFGGVLGDAESGVFLVDDDGKVATTVLDMNGVNSNFSDKGRIVPVGYKLRVKGPSDGSEPVTIRLNFWRLDSITDAAALLARSEGGPQGAPGPVGPQGPPGDNAPNTFLGLTDTPGTYSASRLLSATAAGDAVGFAGVSDDGSALLVEPGRNVDLNDNPMTKLRTAVFNSAGTNLDLQDGTEIDFGTGQKQSGTLNADNANITLRFPGVGNYILVLAQPDPNGFNLPVFALPVDMPGLVRYPGGTINVGGGDGDITVLALFYDGADLFVTSAEKMVPGAVNLT